MSTDRTTLGVLEVLRQQSAINASIAHALQAWSLEADRYDAELRDLRGELRDLRERVAALEGLAESRGDDADLMTCAEVLRMLDERGWSVKA